MTGCITTEGCRIFGWLPSSRVRLGNGRFLVTITVENLGRAGAEVPVMLRMEGGEVRQRVEVRGQAKASLRIEASSKPLEVVINDGSVPESDISNNTYKIEISESDSLNHGNGGTSWPTSNFSALPEP